MPRPSLEVAQIFRHHGPEYRQNHGLSPEQHQAMRDIERCRTSSLGGHVDYCEHGCGYLSISYNSCRNRHCPKCQSLKQARWLEERRERLLPTHYFHLVVTLPHELNPLALSNKELVFNLLFAAASRALRQFARDYDRLPGPGRLHGSAPHLGSESQLSSPSAYCGHGWWAECRCRYLDRRRQQFPPARQGTLKDYPGKISGGPGPGFSGRQSAGHASCLAGPVPFRRFLRKLKRKKWVVYSKELFNGSHKAYHTPQPLHPPGGHLPRVIDWLAWRMARSPSEPETIADPVSRGW